VEGFGGTRRGMANGGFQKATFSVAKQQWNADST
jgi:hypothetical protein